MAEWATRFAEEVYDCRRAITGDDDPLGTQEWFRDVVEAYCGWRPGKATVHRWFNGETEPDGRAEDALTELASVADRFGPAFAAGDGGSLGDKRERNVLILADWLRGDTMAEVGERHGVSKQTVSKIRERAGVRRENL